MEIPFGRRQLIGVVKQITTKPDFATKSVGTALDVPVLPTYLQELATWMSTYYATSLTTVWNTFLPTGLSKHRRTTVEITPSSGTGLPAFALTSDQQHALTVLADPKLDRILLEGVTGSGKTRVYLELVTKCLASNRSAIILVPEITLTPQIVRQFETTFGSGVVLASHSKMTEANRHSIWKQALAATDAKQPKIIIGPRSCLFLPAWQIGLIVVDECHESSYKQDRQPRYHTLAVATYLARLCTARLVLGSATPGINEQYLTTQGRFKTVFLPTRANNLPLPKARSSTYATKIYSNKVKLFPSHLLPALLKPWTKNAKLCCI
ncbi:DEAD/DEAH box helicase family protein [bacterium]|nr:MAG: DEAD/DEAH box helicase family protein [bacterium]